MTNDLMPFPRGQVSKVFGDIPQGDDPLSAGIAASYAVMGYKGKAWSVKYRGDEQLIMRDDGDGPRNSIEVVIVGSSMMVSKIFYAAGYIEGSNQPPDCFSNNGVAPDPTSPALQSPTCAACPRNVWGSKISEVSGKPGKQCQDSKRLAITPLSDIRNEMYGGPILLRVPAASLQELAQFGNKMKQLGYPHYTYATRISFDSAEAYPKFVFNAIRVLDDTEAEAVKEVMASPAVKRILAEELPADYAQSPVPVETVKTAFEQPPVTSAGNVSEGSKAWQTTQSPSPSTGPVSSTPVQPAAQPQPKQPAQPAPQGQNGPMASGTPRPSPDPATASPQPTPTPAGSPTPSQGGSATTANTEKKRGFGSTVQSPASSTRSSNGGQKPTGSAPTTQMTQAASHPSSATPAGNNGSDKVVVEHVQREQHVQQEHQDERGQVSEFEKGLDALLEGMLPK